MYKSVRDFFAAEHPELVHLLDRQNGWWPRIRENTISNFDLERNERAEDMGDASYKAAHFVFEARKLGKIARPE